MTGASKAAIIILVILALVPIFVLPLFPLPDDEQSGCITTSGAPTSTTTCGPVNQSLTFAIFGRGYLSNSTGQYQWCTRTQGPGFGFTC